MIIRALSVLLIAFLFIIQSCSNEADHFIGRWRVTSKHIEFAIKKADNNYILSSGRFDVPAFYEKEKDRLTINYQGRNQYLIYSEDEDVIIGTHMGRCVRVK